MDRRSIEALQRHVDSARIIARGLKVSETKGYVDPSFDLSRDEAIMAADRLVSWLEDLVYVARTLLPAHSPVAGETGGSCAQCGNALGPQTGPGRPKLYCDVDCRKRAKSDRRSAA